ncbi:MAG: UDP-N-acetylmuramate dehydrogenase [Lachnospiraceae bacterium]|nr:UDP-N-acetylmuramate dehydrogenase [Lachnospiraceae bacterium]
MIERIKALVGDSQVLINEELKKYTTFKVGGPCKALVIIKTEDLLIKVISLLKESKEDFFVIGNGSNLLISDEGFDGYVLKLEGDFLDIKSEGEEIVAGAGAILSKVCIYAKEKGLSGLEFAYGIPGTVGGAIVMNAGAYDGEMSFVVSSVKMLDEKGIIKTFTNPEMEFSYRNSILKRKEFVVLSVTYKLTKKDENEILGKMNDFLERRRSKQPLNFPSAGSTFKRPKDNFAGKLIMEAGLKGKRIGGACVSEKHAGFIVNDEGASAKDISDLMKVVIKEVKEKYDIELEPEVIKLGKFD